MDLVENAEIGFVAIDIVSIVTTDTSMDKREKRGRVKVEEVEKVK